MKLHSLTYTSENGCARANELQNDDCKIIILWAKNYGKKTFEGNVYHYHVLKN